jgi:hypothetical protein
MCGRVDCVQTVCHNGVGVESVPQGSTMGIDVNAIRQSADDHQVGKFCCESGNNCIGHLPSIRGSIPGTHNAQGLCPPEIGVPPVEEQ